MLIRSKSKNTLADFNGSGIFWSGGNIYCACGGASIEIKSANNTQVINEVIDQIQEAFLNGEKLVIIE